jgi:8-oxo-dGTP pyrophosphatase MutT (NUDIX family)
MEAMKDWKRLIEPFTRPLFFAFSRLTRGKTLGVRALVTDEVGRILLVEHTYVKGWWLPGGGVDAGETTSDAMVRELAEEAGIRPKTVPTLVSVHANEAYFPGDHVLLYVVRDFDRVPMTAHGEIKAARFFAFEALPDGINKGSKRRIDEVMTGHAPDPYW